MFSRNKSDVDFNAFHNILFVVSNEEENRNCSWLSLREYSKFNK
jgi:hypothetical protein